MSAYVNRLLDRFSPAASGDMPASVNPFVRSRSPIAQFDQRPGGEDSLEFGSVAGTDDSAELTAPDPGPAPTRIQRKAVGAPAPASPSVNVSPPASAPTPEAASGRALMPEAPAPVAAVPRREPMDPGPLFDPFQRFAAAEQAKLASSHAVEPESGPSPVSPRPQALAFPATPAPTVRKLDPGPAQIPELRAPIEAPAPWHPVEPEVSAPAPTTARFVTPAKPREHAPQRPSVAPLLAPAPESESRPNVIYQATPRANPRTPFVPDPGPRTAESGTTGRPSVHIGRVEIEVVPNSASASTQSKRAPRKPLTIDSISQIGPLARHFPNRRLFRLRYR